MTGTPFIPTNITVHLGAPSAAAQNITLSFPDYIKNVASSEIYPTWPENALIANIYAQISFALNRVYTEWYRSQGYDFDITNSTAFDQAFVPNRDVFENISRIVDNIFNNYLVRGQNVEPFFAQYCNGTTVTCPGLSQWGTVPLAEQGLTPYEILTTFYGNDINIVYDAPIQDIQDSYPGTPLRLGSTGNEVRQLQIRLNRIAGNYPAINKIYPESGIFDLTTEEAVRTFQGIFNLVQDGIVGKATWYKVIFVYNSVKRLAELDSEGLTLGEVSFVYPRALQEGMSGTPVRVIQYFLAVIGRYYDELPQIEIDGYFGPATRDAVVAYQTAFSLTPDGIVGRNTWDSLVSTYLSLIQNQRDLIGSAAAYLYPGRFLVEGISGEDVALLQEYLNGIATVYPSIQTLPVTGYFGEQTRAAVIAAQMVFGLEPNGAVGPLTWNAIAQEYAALQLQHRRTEGQYPGYEIGGTA